MTPYKTRVSFAIAITALLCVAPSAAADAVDASAAEALARKSGCLKCHAVDRMKIGPSFKDVAARYRGRGDAEKTLVALLRHGGKVSADGKEENHDALKTNSDVEARNVVRWILSR